jgi:hypothetical protein
MAGEMKCFRGPPAAFRARDTLLVASAGCWPVRGHKSFAGAVPVRGMDRRADVEVETLLKIVLVLVVVWIGLEIVESVIDFVFGPFKSVFGLIIIVVIVLWLLDRI